MTACKICAFEEKVPTREKQLRSLKNDYSIRNSRIENELHLVIQYPSSTVLHLKRGMEDSVVSLGYV